MTVEPVLFNPASSFSPGFDLAKFGQALKRRKFLIIGIVLSACFGAVWLNANLKPQYTAESQVMLDSRQTRVTSIPDVLGELSLTEGEGVIDTEVLVMQSDPLIARVVDQLNLANDPEFNAALRGATTAAGDRPGLVARVKEDVRAVLRRMRPDGVADVPESDASRRDVIDAVQSAIKVRASGRSLVLLVSVTTSSPAKSARIANAVVEAYLANQVRTKMEATQLVNRFISERLDELQKRVLTSEAAIQQARTKAGIFESKGFTTQQEEVSAVENQLNTERAQRLELEARIREIDAMQKGGNIDASSDVIKNPLIASLRAQESTLIAEQASLRTTFGLRHPKVLAVEAELRDLRTKIATEIGKIRRSLTADLAVARAHEADLAGRKAAIEQRAGQTRQAEVQIAELQRQYDADKGVYDTFLQRARETAQQADGGLLPDARIVAYAAAPAAPSFPKLSILLGAAFVLSTILAVAIALLLERMHDGIRSSDELEQATGLPVLARIPFITRRAARGSRPLDLIVDKPLSVIAESFRALHTKLQLRQKSANTVLMLTSPLAGDGKTFTALGLARTAQVQGIPTIVLDFDLRRAQLHRAMSGAQSPGLAEYLLGQASLEQIIRRDQRTELHYVTAGTAEGAPARLLHSRMLPELIARLRRSYGLVVLDTPPILVVDDALVLATMSDVALLVARHHVTPRRAVDVALRQLRQMGVPLGGAILSQMRRKHLSAEEYAEPGMLYANYINRRRKRAA